MMTRTPFQSFDGSGINIDDPAEIRADLTPPKGDA
jgi:hypothetical protein